VPGPTFGAGLLQLRALGGEADFGEAQEDEAEDGRGVFLRLETGVSAKLIRGIPKALLKRGGGGVFFGWGDPVYAAGIMLFQIVSAANQNDDWRHCNA